jgi:hypothetical protein
MTHTPNNLVVVRCGDRSLHNGWLEGSRNWDLAVSYFGADDAEPFGAASFVHRFKGGKWDGLFAFFSAFPECLERYDYIWLPDDDIKTSGGDISQMFACMAENKFELAQPSLSGESFMSRLIPLQNPLFEYRNVNLVEIMVPILDRRLMKLVLPLFKTTKSGFGFDFVWNRFTNDPLKSVAIIDKIQVTHTRPIGGPLHKLIAAANESPPQELERFLAGYGVLTQTEMILGGKLRSGVVIRRPSIAAAFAALGWILQPQARRVFRPVQISTLRYFFKAARIWYWSLRTKGQFSIIPVHYAPK